MSTQPNTTPSLESNDPVDGSTPNTMNATPPTDSTTDTPQRLVPVTEAIRYRKRAQTAEQQLEALKGQLQDSQVELEQARQSLTALDRRQRIDQILAESDAIDLEVARLLTEAAVADMDEPDIKLAIEDLQRHKPYLFRHRNNGSTTGSAMTARPRDGLNTTTQHAARQAAATGDRRDLLKYLRLRRRDT